jgi:hypothetical protein
VQIDTATGWLSDPRSLIWKTAIVAMTPVDSRQLFLLAGIVIITCLWLVGWSPRDLLLKADNALRRGYAKRRDQKIGGKQVCARLSSTG